MKINFKKIKKEKFSKAIFMIRIEDDRKRERERDTYREGEIYTERQRENK